MTEHQPSEITSVLHDAARHAWRNYLDILSPLRPELHRYCRRLAGNAWDAEDLVQHTLLRGFASLGLVNGGIDNPRGYLIRIASHLWTDQMRHRTIADKAHADPALRQTARDPDPRAVADAGRRLLEQLSPHERAALVLKEVFDFSMAEIAQTLSTSEGAVKSALHRGRDRLSEDPPVRRRVASLGLIAEFKRRLDAADLPGLLELMLDTATIEMPGALLEVGREQFERRGGWLWQSVNVHPDLPPDQRPPKWENALAVFEGEQVVLGFAPLATGRRLQGITRFEEEGGRISRIRSYCFSPELAGEVAQVLGFEVGWIPYRFPSFPAN